MTGNTATFYWARRVVCGAMEDRESKRFFLFLQGLCISLSSSTTKGILHMPNEPAATDVNSYFPSVIDHVVGQQKVIARVKTALESSWIDGVKFPNAVLTGPPGLGKSMIAKTIAAEMGCRLKETLAQSVNNPSNLHAMLLEAEGGDVLFIDECDELHPKIQTHLYRALEDRKIFIGSGDAKKSKEIPLQDFTLLAASNNEFSLVAPLRDRFRLTLRFDYYSVEEVIALLRQRVQALRWAIEPDVLAKIAVMARGTPRIALKLLEACRRTSRAHNSPNVTGEHFDMTKKLEGLDDLGLDETEQKLLHALYEAGEPVALNVLAMRLSLPRKTISSVIEGFLVRENLITKDHSLRKLTTKGRAYIETSRHGEGQ